MENKLYDFINLIARPSYKLPKDEAQKYHREFLLEKFNGREKQ
jgi:hypothetical protein